MTMYEITKCTSVLKRFIGFTVARFSSIYIYLSKGYEASFLTRIKFHSHN